MDGSGDVTTPRDLRTGRPVWLARGAPRLPVSPLDKSIKVDVAVIGAGVSGALVADALLQAGKSVAVLDRRGPVRGSTAASTALLQFELDQPLTTLIRKVGRERAVRAYWRSAAAVGHLRGRISDLGLRCRFKERQTAYLPGNVLNTEGATRGGGRPGVVGLRSRFIDRDELRALTLVERPGAILSAGAAEADPVAMVAGLWRSAMSRGCAIYAPVEVTSVACGRSHVVLGTDGGQEVQADHAVFATGYELFDLIKASGYKVSSTWAMATAPQPKRLWPSRCLIWEAADPYLYLRTTADGRIIVGGEDEPFADDERRDALIAAEGRTIGRSSASAARCGHAAGVRLDGLLRRELHGNAGDRPHPRRRALLCRHRVWRQRHHLQRDRSPARSARDPGIPDPDADLFALPR